MAAVADNTMSMIAGSDDQFHRYRPPSPSTTHSSSSSSSPTDNTNKDKSEFQRDVRELVDLLSKLNPMAKEFVPSRQLNNNHNQFFTVDHAVNGDRNGFGSDGSGFRKVNFSFSVYY